MNRLHVKSDEDLELLKQTARMEERERLIRHAKDYVGALDPTAYSPEQFDMALQIIAVLRAGEDRA